MDATGGLRLRHTDPSDYAHVQAVMVEWWDGRRMAGGAVGTSRRAGFGAGSGAGSRIRQSRTCALIRLVLPAWLVCSPAVTTTV